MTTAWKIEPIWSGQTVAVLAAGPSMSTAVADAMQAHKRIVFKNTIALAPDADLLLSLDPGAEYFLVPEPFAGLRVCGIDDDATDALYAGMFYERVTLGDGHHIEIRNNGLAAIRLASLLGAARIILCGFDPGTRGYWHSEWSASAQAYLQTLPDGADTYPGLAEGLTAITAELRAQGIAVEHYTAPVEQAPAKAANKPAKVPNV